jgi:hypothetical protein
MFIGPNTARTNSVLRSGIQLEPYHSRIIPLLRTESGGSCCLVYKHSTPNGVKPFSSTGTNNDGMKVTGEIVP